MNKRNFRMLVTVACWLYGIVVMAQPNAFFTADTNRIKSLEVLFSSVYTAEDTASYTFLWDFGDGTTGDRPVLTHQYQLPGHYTVHLTVLSGPESDAFSLNISLTNTLSIPNVFTPNQDGINDFFIIKSGGIKQYSFTVFTKSGYKIITIKGTSIVWDGKMVSGKVASPGLYYYTLSDDYGLVRKGFFYLFY